ncbi:MAG: S9 family peptidase, partial [Verrucomicrobiaceae bacterium]
SYRGPFRWSPDSTKLVAHHGKRVTERKITIVQSSPPDQVQPKLITLDYAKPGDEIEQPKPRLFSIANRRQIPLDDALYPNPWSISELEWTEDSASFSFVYNQRGHQILRVIAVAADNGQAKTLIEEKSDTFIDYSQKFFMQRLAATDEILWASERSGYNHLYLIDGKTGKAKNPVTWGELNVRKVVEVDAEKRQLILRIVGTSESNPYYSQFVRIGFDGKGGTKLTEGDGDHVIEFSPDGKHILETWSRVDLPPVMELRDASTGRRIAILEQADDSQLVATGRQRPERFVAKGRDGQTDIHGIIIRPAKFDPAKKYPILEEIYAGPHGNFVPTQYSAWGSRLALADLGFILVRIDG